MSDDATPSAKLAALTVDKLIAAGLLPAERRDALVAKVGAGTMSGADWKLQVDVGVEKAANQ